MTVLEGKPCVDAINWGKSSRTSLGWCFRNSPRSSEVQKTWSPKGQCNWAMLLPVLSLTDDPLPLLGGQPIAVQPYSWGWVTCQPPSHQLWLGSSSGGPRQSQLHLPNLTDTLIKSFIQSKAFFLMLELAALSRYANSTQWDADSISLPLPTQTLPGQQKWTRWL